MTRIHRYDVTELQLIQAVQQRPCLFTFPPKKNTAIAWQKYRKNFEFRTTENVNMKILEILAAELQAYWERFRNAFYKMCKRYRDSNEGVSMRAVQEHTSNHEKYGPMAFLTPHLGLFADENLVTYEQSDQEVDVTGDHPMHYEEGQPAMAEPVHYEEGQPAMAEPVHYEEDQTSMTEPVRYEEVQTSMTEPACYEEVHQMAPQQPQTAGGLPPAWEADIRRIVGEMLDVHERKICQYIDSCFKGTK